MLYRLLLKFWLLPPTINILLVLVGLLLLSRRKVLGLLLIISSLSSLWLISTPYIANQMLFSLENVRSLTTKRLVLMDDAAIVVLGAGNRNHSPEYDCDYPHPTQQ